MAISASTSRQALFDQLCFYTLAHGHPDFIHQHAVDAYAVQTATADTKPIAIVFGLAGLYLHVEKNFTGREVQLAHMRMARQRKSWPTIALPEARGPITIAEVLNHAPGPELDAAIESWSASVWQACSATRRPIAALLTELQVA